MTKPARRAGRRAVYEVERASGEEASCSIELAVKDDVERFTSADDMLEHATAQALRSFVSIRVTVEGGNSKAALLVARNRTAPLTDYEVPGAVLVVSASGPAQDHVGSVRDGIAAAFDRGGFAWARPHRHNGGLSAARSALMSLVSRRHLLAAAYGFGVAAAAAIVIGALALAGIDVSEGLATPVSGAPLIIAAAISIAGKTSSRRRGHAHSNSPAPDTADVARQSAPHPGQYRRVCAEATTAVTSPPGRSGLERLIMRRWWPDQRPAGG